MTTPDGPGQLPDLTRLLREVGAVPAPAADYGSVVRASVARGRLTRLGAVGVAAVALVGLLAVGAVALSGGGDDTVASPTRTTEPTTLPTPDQTLEPTPAPTLEPVPTVEPTPDPTTAPPTVAPPPPPVTQAPPPVTQAPPRTSAPAVTRSPAPRPTTASPKPKPYAAKDLSVSLSAPDTAFADDQTTMTVRVRDTDGLVVSAKVEWGDGRTSTFSIGATCKSRSGTAPESTNTSKAINHTYTAPGSFTAVVTITTGSTCRSTPRETRSASQRIEIS